MWDLQVYYIVQIYWDSCILIQDVVNDDIEAVVKKEEAKLLTGTFDVFYGPIRDQEGNIRVNEGESMSDATMLNDFDWYVEGVVIEHEK